MFYFYIIFSKDGYKSATLGISNQFQYFFYWSSFIQSINLISFYIEHIKIGQYNCVCVVGYKRLLILFTTNSQYRTINGQCLQRLSFIYTAMFEITWWDNGTDGLTLLHMTPPSQKKCFQYTQILYFLNFRVPSFGST